MTVATERLLPRDTEELAAIVRDHRRALEPVGAGTKRAIGHAMDADLLDLSQLTGIVDYEPDELVLTARAATPLAEIEAALAEHGQRLAFEPPDLGPLLGVDGERTLPQTGGQPRGKTARQTSGQTIGGVLATNLSGSRRLSGGAARDHFLGFTAVSGRGERFKAGGKVVKNVTGYDLPKLMAGSWGTLAVLTEVTIRVVPQPQTETTLIVDDDTPADALATLSAALGSAHEVSAAGFDPWRGTLLRLEGFEASVAARRQALRELLGGAAIESLPAPQSREHWRHAGGAEALAEWPVVWRISVPPTAAPSALAALAPERYLLDWGGGLIWAAYDRLDNARVRGAIGEGHATLIKAPGDSRTCVHHPPSAALAAVAERIKAAFDPDNKLNPGRMD